MKQERLHTIILTLIVMAGLAPAAGAWPAFAQDRLSPKRPSRMIEAYATAYEVPVQEAERRLAAQRGVGNLNAKLEAAEAKTFGGLYIEHTPVYRVVVKFTRDGAATLKRYTRDPLFVVLPSSVTYRQLVDAQAVVGTTLKALGVESASRIDVVTSRLEFYVADPAAVRCLLTASALKLSEYIDVKKALDLSPGREMRSKGGR